jgi:hypothetical protein
MPAFSLLYRTLYIEAIKEWDANINTNIRIGFPPFTFEYFPIVFAAGVNPSEASAPMTGLDLACSTFIDSSAIAI